MGQPMKIGIIGLGKISAQYLQTFDRIESIRLVAVADLDPSRAAAVADRGVGVQSCTVPGLLALPDVDLVLNLTIPVAHADIALQAIAAGKSVYGEKPLALNMAQGREVLAAAASSGVVVGCAPDTVLGTGIQTARRAIDDNLIGAPVAATATMVVPGHERWHPDPDFYYQPGGGPLLDMGPYYLTALVTLLGPVTSAIGASSRTRSIRTIGSGPREGTAIPVAVDTHITGILTHATGALSTIVMSFDAVATHSSPIEIHGSLGSLAVPDPNHFHGDVRLRRLGEESWSTLPVSAGYRAAGRGIGLVDLARTPPGDTPRASGALAYHVLDIMESLLASAQSGHAQSVASTTERPSPVALQQVK